MTEDTSVHCEIEFNQAPKRVIEVEARKQVSLPVSVTLRLEAGNSWAASKRIKRWLRAGQAFTRTLYHHIDGLKFEADTQDGNRRLFLFALKITQGQEELDKVKPVDADGVIQNLEKLEEAGSALLSAQFSSIRDQGQKE